MDNRSKGNNSSVIQQQAEAIERLQTEIDELRRLVELLAKGALGPMLVRVNRLDRAVRPRLVVSN